MSNTWLRWRRRGHQENGAGLCGESRHRPAIRKVFASRRRNSNALHGLPPQADRRDARAERPTANVSTNWKRPIAGSQVAAIAARLALAYFQRGAKKEAAELVGETLKLEPKQQLATYVLVKLQKRHTAGGDGPPGKLPGSQGPRAVGVELLAGMN